MHIHVPDGVFPAWIWMTSIIILIPLLTLALIIVRKNQKKLVMTSAITALMLIVFSIEVFGFHLNFTALSGAILGPWWSLISITVTNIFLALFGHGGITVAPINILLNWAEALVGYLVFRIIIRKIKNINIKSAIGAASVLLALALSFTLFVGVISLTGINPAAQLEQGNTSQAAQPTTPPAGAPATGASAQSTAAIPLQQFVAISIIPTLIGAIIEAILTFLMLRFILKSKPDLLK
jgi:ABC-type Co2+ transport system permease subunit